MAAPDVYDLACAWLAASGVDVDRQLTRLDRAREYETHRAREAADRATSLALDLKTAEKRLLFEARGFSAGCPGFNRTRLGEAQDRVNDLAAALDEACFHDQDMVRGLRRQVA